MRRLNYDDPVAITRDISWIGFYDEPAHLHCNPYILFDDDGEVVLIDPGSVPHFPIVMRKVIDLTPPENITLIISQHQDPDVCGSLPVLEDVIGRSDLKIAAHMNSIRLIRHLGVKSAFYPVDENDYRIELKSGRVLDFIFTPYLHSPGAIMTYDSDTKSLFTSDIFGAVSKGWSLFAGEGFPENMASFHQTYMPSNVILKSCMERIEKMDVDRILPQHGSIIEGKDIQVATEYLKFLPCGIDLQED
jgi:flavorubredoxin